MLTLLASPAQRAQARALWHERLPGASVRDVASASDAVLAHAARPADLVLVDQRLGRPLPPLVRQLRRSAPAVTVYVFGDAAAGAGDRVRPWDELEATLRRWIERRLAGAQP